MAAAHMKLARLLQLASPALPVGAYSYSQGLESAVEAGRVRDAQSAQQWIEDVLELAVSRMEAPLFLRLWASWRSRDIDAAARWNAQFLASRESAELRAETVQMGYSLAQLLPQLCCSGLPEWDEISFPAAFTFAAVRWELAPADALVAYLWSWCENQVMAAIKAVPLGQTDGQKILLALGDTITSSARGAAELDDDALGNFSPGLALLSARHETQYTRLFRS